MIEPRDIMEIAHAQIVATVSQAADQDGYDGGWIARDDNGNEAWGATFEEAKQNLIEIQK